jgi:L-fucose mutarotase
LLAARIYEHIFARRRQHLKWWKGNPMLKGIDPLLNADLLYVLESMGHGDDLVISDTNFPSDSVAHETVYGDVVRINAPTAARAVRAILSVMPLDSFVPAPALRMEVVGNPADVLPVAAEVQAEIDRAEGKPLPLGTIERFAFYEAAKKSYVVVQTGERRFYGCFILKKGVIPPDAA